MIHRAAIRSGPTVGSSKLTALPWTGRFEPPSDWRSELWRRLAGANVEAVDVAPLSHLGFGDLADDLEQFVERKGRPILDRHATLGGRLDPSEFLFDL